MSNVTSTMDNQPVIGTASGGTTGQVLVKKSNYDYDTEWKDKGIEVPTSSAQGDILIHDASGWTRLAAGTSGQLLKTQGAGANPVWETLQTSSFPSGTVMLFAQTSAPAGWTKVTTHDNKALRVVSGTAGSGGSVAFTTAFASQSAGGTVGATTLTEAQIPSHRHSSYGPAGSGNGGDYPYLGSTYTGYTGGGQSHTHSFSGTAINLAVQYVDVILATKD